MRAFLIGLSDTKSQDYNQYLIKEFLIPVLSKLSDVSKLIDGNESTARDLYRSLVYIMRNNAQIVVPEQLFELGHLTEDIRRAALIHS